MGEKQLFVKFFQLVRVLKAYFWKDTSEKVRFLLRSEDLGSEMDWRFVSPQKSYIDT